MGCYRPNFIVKHKIDPIVWIDRKNRDNKYSDFKVMKDQPIEYAFIPGCRLKEYRDYFKDWKDKDYELTPVPCGCCIGCRLDYSRDWATRCLLEAEKFKFNYFLTLTYDENHLPMGKVQNATLVPDDFTNFMKRLRIYFKREFNHDNIRFFGCGEYGDTSMRPHYHIICFNLPIPDLTEEFRYIDDDGKEIVSHHCKDGVIYYYSDIIHKLWGKGNIVIGEVTFQSCAYTARYVVKKLKGESSEAYDILGIVPPFVRMSRSPGLAYDYFMSKKDEIYDSDGFFISTQKGAQFVAPPRYFDKMYQIENELRFYSVKEDRKQRGDNYLNTLYENTTLHYDDYLDVLENLKELQINSLKRII